MSLIEALEVILGIKVESEEYDRLRTHADEWEAELAEEMAKDYERLSWCVRLSRRWIRLCALSPAR